MTASVSFVMGALRFEVATARFPCLGEEVTWDVLASSQSSSRRYSALVACYSPGSYSVALSQAGEELTTSWRTSFSVDVCGSDSSWSPHAQCGRRSVVSAAYGTKLVKTKVNEITSGKTFK